MPILISSNFNFVLQCSYKFAVHCFATVKLSEQAIITTVNLLNIQQAAPKNILLMPFGLPTLKFSA